MSKVKTPSGKQQCHKAQKISPRSSLMHRFFFVACPFISLQTKELHNGRAAMMGIAGLVTHNLITGGMPAFEQISRGVYTGGIQ